jgi:dienelactone hydrolase
VTRSNRLRIALLLLVGARVWGQTDRNELSRLLEPALQSPEVTSAELQRYLEQRIPKLTVPASREQFDKDAQRWRRDLLGIVLAGWPNEWVNSPLRVEDLEDLGLVPSGPGYRIRKLRFEIIPGLEVPAVLYEPESIHGRVPAILNVHGHAGPEGKAVEYKQKRCINQALQGMFALSMEWLGFGELTHPENVHWFAGHLDLVGANGVGIFYLTIRRALDYLYQHPSIDRQRIGMTGLSGGGWQTILLSSLDERVAAAAPVAGYGPHAYKLSRVGEVGDLEQNPTDLFASLDYTHLTALLAPRPALLIYNAEDNCCWRAPLIKPLLYDPIAPFYRLHGCEERFLWHENLDPADHNYQLDNRMQSYRFFARQFGLPNVEREIPVADQVKSVEELTVGVRKDNLTILGLARKLATALEKAPGRDAETALLENTIRFQPVEIHRVWPKANSKRAGVESISYRFEFEGGLSATAVWIKAIDAPANTRAALILHDGGKKAAALEVSGRINRGEQVLVADLLFTGDMIPTDPPGVRAYTQMLATMGYRPLGVETAQLLGLSRWLAALSGNQAVRLESTGIRSQVASLAASALNPKAFSEVTIHEGMRSLKFLLDAPVDYRAAPDLFCLNLYRDFDIDRLAAMSAPAKITQMYAARQQ